MALGTGKVYNLKAIQFVIGAVPILGGFVDDAISVVPDSDLFSQQDGADGFTVWSKLNIDTYTVTVSVSEASQAAVLLDGVVQAALLAINVPGVPALLPGTIVDPISGESISWASAVPWRMPDRSKGPTAGARVYVFKIKDPIITPAALNAAR